MLDLSEGATAPRSARWGGRIRGSRCGSLHSPRATHGYYIDRSAVAEDGRFAEDGRDALTAKRSQPIAGGHGGERSDPPLPPVRPPTSSRPRSGRTERRMRAHCQQNRNDLGMLDLSEGATAPRSARWGGRIRGSRCGSLHSPRATHGYYIDRSAVAEDGRVYGHKLVRPRRSSLKPPVSR